MRALLKVDNLRLIISTEALAEVNIINRMLSIFNSARAGICDSFFYYTEHASLTYFLEKFCDVNVQRDTVLLQESETELIMAIHTRENIKTNWKYILWKFRS